MYTPPVLPDCPSTTPAAVFAAVSCLLTSALASDSWACRFFAPSPDEAPRPMAAS